MSLKEPVRTAMLETSTGASINLSYYQPRANLVKNEKGDLLAKSHSILNRLKNHFCLLFNVNAVHEVRQTEIFAHIQLSL
jgi:hypothetical protein